jgi:AbrB family looped-hinge helix DNA binding protein
MKFRASIDRAGRIALTKDFLRKMQLRPGDKLLIEVQGDRISLRPIRPKAMVKKQFGVWVYQGRPSSQSICRLVDKERKKRLHKIL